VLLWATISVSGRRPPLTASWMAETIMAFKDGQVYRCPDPACGCEVTVTKGSPPTCQGTLNPTCCWGMTMGAGQRAGTVARREGASGPQSWALRAQLRPPRSVIRPRWDHRVVAG
jgi:hypothetical protein